VTWAGRSGDSGERPRRQQTPDPAQDHPQPAELLHGVGTEQSKVEKRGKKSKDSPYSITERRVPELIPVLGSQPAGDVSHKPGGRLPLLSARPAVTLATLKRAATNFAAW